MSGLGRELSNRAYRAIMDDLPEMRGQVFAALYVLGKAATCAEIASQMPPAAGGRGGAGNVHPRIEELIDQGLVRYVGVGYCSVGKQKEAMKFDLTGRSKALPHEARLARLLSKQSRKTLERMKQSYPAHRKAIQDILQLVEQEEGRRRKRKVSVWRHLSDASVIIDELKRR